MRLLKANEIEARVGVQRENGVSLLLYKDARCDMNILDEEFGCEKWQRDHKELKGNIYCGVSVLTENGWVTKWDAGSESKTEAEKGEASDSFKRACVNWGIGRELYTSPFIWIETKALKMNGNKVLSKFKVIGINYNDDRSIKDVTITVDGRAKVFSNEETKEKPKQESKVSQEQKQNLIKLAASKGYSEQAILNHYEIKDILELDLKNYNEAIINFMALEDK